MASLADTSGPARAAGVRPPAESVHPPALSLPRWPEAPPPADGSGTGFLVIAVGGDPATAAAASGWLKAAQEIGPATLVVLGTMTSAGDRAALGRALRLARTGVRICVTGGQYDVLQVLAAALAAGAIPAELRSFVTSRSDLPMYCVHCRATSRVEAAPGELAGCPACGRTLEVHPHCAAVRGSFLASDATARTLP